MPRPGGKTATLNRSRFVAPCHPKGAGPSLEWDAANEKATSNRMRKEHCDG